MTTRRTIFLCPPRPTLTNYHPCTYTIEVITPLFGGGVETGVNDPVTLIRPSSIRGHLRFWWRATRGAALCKDVAELRLREGDIWGSTENPSQVKVIVEVEKKGDDLLVGRFIERKQFRFDVVPPYAAFPARPQYDGQKTLEQNNDTVARFRNGIEFTLRLEFPTNLEGDIQAAVTAWVNFGGIGARTRRGFGALYCQHLAPEGPVSFDAFVKTLGTDKENASSWPVLFQCYDLGNHKKLSRQKEEYLAAWKEGIDKLQAFRQSPPIGRQAGSGKKHGRSHWPEAEAVRNLVFAQRKTAGGFTGSRSATNPAGWHEPDSALSTRGVDPVYFPRAEFGLPIIWEIKPETLPNNKENLKPTLQYDEKHDRLASPLIIRPIRFQNGTVCPLFLRLRTPSLNAAYLKPGEKDVVGCEIGKVGQNFFL
ncbi:MAG: type III-B CRISPR module RAMP protein Cmr1 [Gammaproteobacteria bacterium]